MSELTIDGLGYVEEMRQRLGRKEDDHRVDAAILAMEPMERVELITGWFLGGTGWAESFKSYCESQGVYLTTNPDAEGIIP